MLLRGGGGAGSGTLRELEEGARAEARNPLSGLARTDAGIDRALLSRLERLERSASYFDGLCVKVGRELRRHRGRVLRRAGAAAASGGAGGGGFSAKRKWTGFLADADLDDAGGPPGGGGLFYPRMPQSRVGRARLGVFGAGSAARTAQPTLTQMVRGEAGPDGTDGEEEEKDDDDDNAVILVEAGEGSDQEPQQSRELRAPVIGDGEAAAEARTDYAEPEAEDVPPLAVLGEAPPPDGGLDRSSGGGDGRGGTGLWGAATAASAAMAIPGGIDFWVDRVASSDGGGGGGEDGIDELLDLFASEGQDQAGPGEEGGARPDEGGSDSEEDPDGGPAELQSQLTQRGRAAAEELRDSVLADPPRREAIEAACPGWRESVRFPFLHTKGTGVRSALERVRERRRRLDVARRRLLDRLYQQESALELFEATLERSLRRLEGGEEEGSA